MTDSAHADESRVSEEPAADRLWADGLILLLHIILPIAITGVILGRNIIFAKLLTHLDKSCISVFCPSFSKREKLKKWMSHYLPYVDGADGGLAAIWKDGSLMCTLINSVVPGACPNPHRHWKKPPIHGQALAYKYLGIVPVFIESDFDTMKLTTSMEKLLVDYMSNLQQAIDKMLPNEELTFSNRYIARGMGLVTGEQHRRTIIYIYPNCKGPLEDLLVNIRGPYNTYGNTTLGAREFAKEKDGKAPAKRQRSFLKSLSTDFSNLLKAKDKGPACDIQIKTAFEKERAKLIFIPNNSGVYEICLTTNGEHIAGSPFNLNIEKNRSGITDNLNEDILKETKSAKRKVLNTVIYYEKLKKGDFQKITECNSDSNEDKCKIDMNRIDGETKVDTNCNEVEKGINIFEKEDLKLKELAQRMNAIEAPILRIESKDIVVDKIEETAQIVEPNLTEFNLPILETLEQLNNLLETNLAKGDLETIEVSQMKRENFGLNIIDTLRDIPALKKIEPSVTVVDGPTAASLQLDTRDQTESKRKVFALNKSSSNCTQENEANRNIQEFIFSNHNIEAQSEPPNMTLFHSSLSSCEHIHKTAESNSCLEDSGTYVNEDIDPDSLTSSVETHGSSEEISFSTGSDNNSLNEVNNNDIMVKSNEDICYLILNQSDQHKRVYSKDFISCKDDKSKDDLSMSDPNLHIADTIKHNLQDAHNVSALSQDNVQEACKASLHQHQTSRILAKKHPQEGRIAGTRSHSYSYSSLIDSKSNNNDGLEFKQHFLRRKAFWTHISMSNMNLASDGRMTSRSSSKLNVTEGNKYQNKVIVRTESAKQVNSDEAYRSRSLDYVRQRKKNNYGYESTTSKENKYGSVDDLNFPSVRNRMELYLKEPKHAEKQELYAVRGDKCSWSIHEKIKCFEPTQQPSSASEKPEKLKTVPENLTVKTKIKERFEKAQTYFKELENQTNDGNACYQKRRYSLDGENNSVLAQRFASLRYVADRLHVKDAAAETEPPECNATSNEMMNQTTRFSNTIGVSGGIISPKVKCAEDALIDDKLQLFLNECKKKKHSRTAAIDVFN